MVYGACDKCGCAYHECECRHTRLLLRCAEWFDRCAEWLAVIDKLIFSVVLFFGGMALISILQNLGVNLAWW